jgi:hypothetical protein
MTIFPHDQFAKDYLEELLGTLGEVKAPREVRSEVRQIDVWFAPAPQLQRNAETLGLLGQMATTPCLFEPFRNAIAPYEISTCLLKLLEIHAQVYREANRSKTRINIVDLPKLWILTPTASEAILSGFGAKVDANWLPGIYFLPDYLRTAIVVIHQLPRTPETLWLRMLGKGKVQSQAIDELESLPTDHQFRSNALLLLSNLRSNLEVSAEIEAEDRELVMRLSPILSQQLDSATQQGLQQGQRQIVENLLKVRFGGLDEELSAIILPVLSLSPEEFTPLLLQLSRDELVARFGDRTN